MAESSTESGVKVIVRIRPFLKKQSQQQSDEIGKRCVTVQGNNVVQLQNHKIANSDIICYKFDACYGEQATQEQIFSNEVNPLLEQLFRGINLSVFAYGVTGAGKTHTMQGSKHEPGIIPRSVSSLFEIAKDEQRRNPDSIYCINFGYIELYNEKIYDLLNDKSRALDIREDQFGNIMIPGLQNIEIKTLEEFSKAYTMACKNRTTAATNLNSQSSRSHAILIVSVTKRTKNETPYASGESILHAKLNLIDLAGSEDNRRTDNKGIRMQESTSINQSLFALGNVVNALNKGQARIPYRNSKLTRLLQDSLGGNSNSILVANIAPAQQFYMDTFNTLNFASKSKKIVNNPVVNCQYERHALLEENQPLENKRSVENVPSHPSKRHKAASGKENVAVDLEAQLENMLEKKGAELLSPFLKKHGVLKDPSILERLANLERQISIQAAFTSQVTDGTTASTKPTKQLGPSQTPTSGVRSVKVLVMQAKNQEAQGNFDTAIQLYKQADDMLAIVQDNAASENEKEKTESHRLKLAKKMEKIQMQNSMPVRKLELDFKEDPPMRKLVLEFQTVPPVINSESKENSLLRVLNSGSLKELVALKGIGQKRAQKIIETRAEQPFQEIADLKSAGIRDKLLASLLENNSC